MICATKRATIGFGKLDCDQHRRESGLRPRRARRWPRRDTRLSLAGLSEESRAVPLGMLKTLANAPGRDPKADMGILPARSGGNQDPQPGLHRRRQGCAGLDRREPPARKDAAVKTHMDLYGWEIRRVDRPYSRDQWFNLWLRGGIFPAAGGSLDFIAKVLRKRIGA